MTDKEYYELIQPYEDCLLYTSGNKLWEFRVTPCKSVPQVLKFK